MSSAVNNIPTEAVTTVELAQELIRCDTINPPGNEKRAADLIASRLHALGIVIERYEFEPGRDSIVARLNPGSAGPALCFCGHLDTVPLGADTWKQHPLSGEISEDRIWGRGSTDMKCGVASMVTAFERLHLEGTSSRLILALVASEETGCQGAAQIVDRLGSVAALVIGEPTGGELAIGHKGVLWLKLVTNGKASHGSMPQHGVNAIDAMANVIVALRHLKFGVASHPLLGLPTCNVGIITGGVATNIVPDRCECMLDIRLVPGLTVVRATILVKECVGDHVELETVLALDAVASDPASTWIESVAEAVTDIECRDCALSGVPYFTDASVLVPALQFPPVAIIGPGDPSLAHQVDEVLLSIGDLAGQSAL